MLETEFGHGDALGAGMPPFAAAAGIAGLLAPGDAVVHPAHGIGRFEARETQDLDGDRLDVLRLRFDERHLTLRVPVAKAGRSGLRLPMASGTIGRVMAALAGAPRASRAIWARRAIEFTAKVNSGDPMLVAEVVRDLGRHAERTDLPLGERFLFEQAVQRLAAEIAEVEGASRAAVSARIIAILAGRRARGEAAGAA